MFRMYDIRFLKVTIKCSNCNKTVEFLDYVPIPFAQEYIEKALPNAVCEECTKIVMLPEFGLAVKGNAGHIELREFTLGDAIVCPN